MFIYETSPQDFWFGMKNVHEILEIPSEKYYEAVSKEELLSKIVEAAYLVAKAKGSHWEGDYREMYIFGLPDPDRCNVVWGIAWKQSNNGTTFICSPFELPWVSTDSLLAR